MESLTWLPEAVKSLTNMGWMETVSIIIKLSLLAIPVFAVGKAWKLSQK
jgi:hypothetical protein